MGVVPSSLKVSHIIPIHKGDHRGIPANYRPIALTSQLIKLFEKVIRNKLVSYLDEGNLLNQSQHGFRHGRSCLSQLLAHYDEVLDLLEKGLNVDTIYLDFSKAFDKVDHQIVIAKLSSLGIGGKLLDWLVIPVGPYAACCSKRIPIISFTCKVWSSARISNWTPVVLNPHWGYRCWSSQLFPTVICGWYTCAKGNKQPQRCFPSTAWPHYCLSVGYGQQYVIQ